MRGIDGSWVLLASTAMTPFSAVKNVRANVQFNTAFGRTGSATWSQLFPPSMVRHSMAFSAVWPVCPPVMKPSCGEANTIPLLSPNAGMRCVDFGLCGLKPTVDLARRHIEAEQTLMRGLIDTMDDAPYQSWINGRFLAFVPDCAGNLRTVPDA